MNIYEESLKLHKELKGKLSIESKIKIKDRKDLSLAYTPGVAEPCRRINKDPEAVYKYTIKSNCVAVVSDGSAVLGLGNIGAEAALPVMEGKAVLFKEFAGIDAFPICLKTQDPDEIVNIVKNIAPVFGGINLEDISAPRCFEIEEKLQDIGIPVMHDDQHGTAIVVLAAMINSLKLIGKTKDEVKIVLSGAGAAGTAIFNLLVSYGFQPKNMSMIDSKGIISASRDDLNKYKKKIAEITEKDKGGLSDAIKGADIFIGVSKAGLLKKEMVKSMAEKPVIIAMANPEPEITPEEAKEAGAYIIASGRSDYPNQVNNVLAFPGIFKGALNVRAKRITKGMKIAAAEAIASIVEDPSPSRIIPEALDKNVSQKVAEAIEKEFKKENN